MTPTRALASRALSGVAVLVLSLGGAVGALVFAAAGPASADSISVTNTADDGTSTSLRGVLADANDGDVIVLTAGATYQLTRCEVSGGALGTGQLSVGADVTIEGNGATIEQTCQDRVISTQDPITIENVTITGGDTEGDGGGLLQDSKNPVTLTGVTFTGNSASEGGGLETFGNVTMTGCTFTDNHAVDGNGGGIHVHSDVATVLISTSTFSGNTASQYGGAFEQDTFEDLPVPEPGPDAAAVGDYFVLTVTGSTIVDNTAESNGGGGLDTEDVAQITIDNSTVSGNQGGGGGGVGAWNTTFFSSTGSTYSGNTTDGAGSAVYVDGGGEEEPLAAATDGTTANFLNDTVTGNTEGAFGAVAVHGAVSFNQVTMTNNTSLGQANDTATSSGRSDVGTFAVEGDAANLAAETFSSRNSVVAQPHGAVNCTEFDGPATDGGYNFSDDTSCGFTAPTSSQKTPNDPGLGPLANNGGPTLTLLPQVGSPLLDAIPPAACGAPVDQRGVTRPQGTGCDIGAVEVEVVTPAPAAVVTPKFTG